MNSGYIVEGLIVKLLGSEKKVEYQIGPVTFSSIENKLGANLQRIKNISDAFIEVCSRPSGSIAVVIIVSHWGYGHALLITNQQNTAVLIEGQSWGSSYSEGIYTNVEEASERYGENAEVWIGFLPIA